MESSMFLVRFGFGFGVRQKNGKVYGRWLVLSRIDLKKSKHNGQASFANIYVLNRYILSRFELRTQLSY